MSSACSLENSSSNTSNIKNYYNVGNSNKNIYLNENSCSNTSCHSINSSSSNSDSINVDDEEKEMNVYECLNGLTSNNYNNHNTHNEYIDLKDTMTPNSGWSLILN